MDGRQPMPAYYLHHRGMGALPVFRQVPNPAPAPAFQLESWPPAAGATHGGGGGGGGNVGGEIVKKKRGRPRKYVPDGAVSLALTPVSSATEPGGSRSETPKRGRGRPPGTGKKQLLASLGEWVAGSAGMGFTPHVVTIPTGEDIAAKIMSFSQQGPRAVCILSGNGSVSTVTLRQPASTGGTITYEGRFEILGMSGSYLLTDDGVSRSRSGGLSICLSSPDGRVIGGVVGGLLIAASNVQVIVGSFIYRGSKSKNKAKTDQEEAGPESEPPTREKQNQSSTPPNQSFSPPVMDDAWPVSKQMDIRNPSFGFDLTQG